MPKPTDSMNLGKKTAEKLADGLCTQESGITTTWNE